jgi:hypothetical protein
MSNISGPAKVNKQTKAQDNKLSYVSDEMENVKI